MVLEKEMRYTKPGYFDNFKCIAGDCPDTCCAGWQIMIDEEALERYGEEKGEFRKRLLDGIDWQEGSFYQYNRRCSMLNDDNLCDMVIAMGENSLCETCRRYPRHEEEFEGVREWSLSLSCPVAAHMILESEKGLELHTTEDEEEDPLWEEFEDFDVFLFTLLEDARGGMFRIVQNREISLEERMESLLQLAMGMQQCLDENKLYEMENLIASYEEKGYDNKRNKNTSPVDADEKAKNRFRELHHHFHVFYRMERLREEWDDVLKNAESVLYEDKEAYCRIRQEFMGIYGSKAPRYAQRERFLENLLLFFLYTYFCGAVYDDWIYSKVALAVFSTLFVEEFVMCEWFLADKNNSWSQWVELAYRYAREVEHSDENLDILEEWLQHNPYKWKGTEH